MMIRISLILLSLAISTSLLSQTPNAEIQGHTRVAGNLRIGHEKDSTTIYMGVNAGIKISSEVEHRNTFLGYKTGDITVLPSRGSSLGKDNTLFGALAGDKLSWGSGNTLIGTEAGSNLSTGSYNTMIGYQAGYNTNGDSSVFIGYRAGKNASKQDQVLYINNTSGDNPLIFGDFKRKMVGINYNGNNLNDALHVEGAPGEDALRVRIGGTTRLRVHDNGGVSIGANHRPSDPNSLMVKNLQGSMSGRVTADEYGRIARKQDYEWMNVDEKNFRRQNWARTLISPLIYNFDHLAIDVYPIFTPIPLRDQTRLIKAKIRYQLGFDDLSTARFRLYLRTHKIENSSVTTNSELLINTNSANVNEITDEVDLDILVDNSEYYYDLYATLTKPGLSCIFCQNTVWIFEISLAYEYE